jgi:hypothetical protein
MDNFYPLISDKLYKMELSIEHSIRDTPSHKLGSVGADITRRYYKSTTSSLFHLKLHEVHVLSELFATMIHTKVYEYEF